jgi:hypothetical protein
MKWGDWDDVDASKRRKSEKERNGSAVPGLGTTKLPCRGAPTVFVFEKSERKSRKKKKGDVRAENGSDEKGWHS